MRQAQNNQIHTVQLRSTVKLFSANSINVTAKQVARYAGGIRYRLDAKINDLVTIIIERARRLTAPAMVYAFHPVKEISHDGVLLLESGNSLNIPLKALNSQFNYLVAVICTIGPALEMKCLQLNEQGDPLQSIFLDATGVACLEALSDQAYKFLCGRAQAIQLFTGCRFGPGIGEMPLASQSLLFSLVDGAAIGVRLKKSKVMYPNKSLSFMMCLSRDENVCPDVYKCRSCPITNCHFRMI
jgi:cobalamin-dependent methionine synthase I